MLLGATIAVGACTDQSALPTGSTSTSDATEPITSAALVVDVDGFFTGRGCVLQRALATPTSIAIRRQDGHYAIFDCDGVEAKEIAAAEREYHNYLVSIRSPVFGAYATAGYYSWAYSSSEYVCSSGGSISISGYSEYPRYVLVTTSEGESWQEYVFGNYTITGSSTGSCDWVDTFVGTYHEGTGDGDGGGDDGGCCAGGPGGDVPPSSPPPPPPPPVPDSVQFAGLDWLSDDLPADPPVCTPTSELDRRIHAWCHGTVPDSGQFQRITDAIASIRARGGQCIPFADVLEAILPDLRLFVQANYPPVGGRQFSGVSLPGAGAQGWMALSLDWVDKYGSFRSPLRISVGGYNLRFSLEDALAHEADHLLGADTHAGPPGGGELIFTPLQQQCSPFGTQWP